MVTRFSGVLRLLLLSCLFLGLCVPAWSQTYFYDNFDEGHSDNWKLINGGWDVKDGEFVSINAEGEAKAMIRSDLWDAEWGGNYTMEAKWMYETIGTAGVMVRIQDAGATVAYSCNTSEGALGFHLKDEKQPWTKHIIAPMVVEADRWYKVKVECVGDTVTIYLDGEKKGVLEGAELKEGPMGLKSLNTPNVHYDEILVYGPDGPDKKQDVTPVGSLSIAWGWVKDYR